MTDWMPDSSPDQMRAVMARQPLLRPGIPGQIPGAPLSPVSSAVAAASAPPGSITPSVAPVPVTQPQATPRPPSDDPLISPEMRKAMQPVQDAQSALDAEQKRATELEGQVAALHAPTHDEYKVPLWKKITAPFVGALAGREAGPAVDTMINGRFNQATQDYQTKSGALLRQLEAERGINIPLATDRARVAQEGFQNALNLRKEAREQTAFANEPTGRVPIMRTGPDGQPHYYEKTKGGQEIEVPEPREQAEDRRRREEDANTPAFGARPEPDPVNKGQQRVRTKAGGYMPWNPRTVEEGALAGDPRATSLYNREHPGREPAAGLSSADSRELTTRQRPLQRQVDALEKERAVYIHNIAQSQGYGTSSPAVQAGIAANQKHVDDLDKQKQGLLDKMDSIEEEILSRHAKNQPSTKGFTVPKNAPPPSKPNQDLKVHGKVVETSIDGRTWGPPAP